ncbi:MAG: SEC-C metal-binding domain-containing protein [Rhodoferax sp.]
MTLSKPDPYRPCPCGSGRKYKFCCHAKQQLVSNAHPLALVKAAAQYPISQCVINQHWQQGGMANIFIARQLPNAKFLFAGYLVDLLCLGVKDTFFNANVPQAELDAMPARFGMPIEPIDFEDARSIILGSIEFADQHGFVPHADWQQTQYLVEPDRPFEPKFTFGKHGKPLFIVGPDDDITNFKSRLKLK